MSLKYVPNRIYAQYRDKPKMVEWLRIARTQGAPIDETELKVARSYIIDEATGAQLDVIGRIVGVTRDFINKIPLDAPQFGADADEDCDFGAVDGFFSAPSMAADSVMSDGLFRLLIKAKILKNNRNATIEDIIEQMVLLVDADFLRVNNPGDMTFSIEFAGDITPLQRYALFNEDIIQIPQGVLFNGFVELTGIAEFGNDDDFFGNEESMFAPYGGI